MEFVSNLDEVVLFLSKQGFFGYSCKMHALIVYKAV